MLWNKTLECGIPKIDEQHQELFRQIDILLDNSQKDRVPETLKFLGEYVVKHFNDEQIMHNASKYPKAAPHKQYHVKFIDTYKQLKDDYEKNGQNLMTLMKINKTCVSWLKDHIMVHDREFAQYYKTQQG